MSKGNLFCAESSSCSLFFFDRMILNHSTGSQAGFALKVQLGLLFVWIEESNDIQPPCLCFLVDFFQPMFAQNLNLFGDYNAQSACHTFFACDNRLSYQNTWDQIVSNLKQAPSIHNIDYRQLHIPSKPKTEPNLLYWITWVQTEGFQHLRNRDEMLKIWILR